MTVNYELDLDSFEAWSGAVNTLDRIQREGKTAALEQVLEELYPDGMSETELNDLLWFEPDTVYEWVGLPTESSIKEAIEEKEEELEDLRSDYEDECSDDMTEEEKRLLWEEDYAADAKELQEELDELEAQLEEV